VGYRQLSGTVALILAVSLVAARGESSGAAPDATSSAGVSTNPFTVAAATSASDVSSLQVVSQRTVHLPDYKGAFVSMSPDGRWLAAAFRGTTLCILSAVDLSEQSCIEDNPSHPYHSEQPLAWSPDSSQIAFTENSFKALDDSDVWIMDVATGKLTDLTDDGITGQTSQGTPWSEAEPVAHDVFPAWSPDGQWLYFVRNIGLGPSQRTDIYRVSATGGSPDHLVTLSTIRAYLVNEGGIFPTADGKQIFFSEDSFDSVPFDGVWSVQVDGSDLRQILGTTDPTLGSPILTQITTSGGWGLVMFTRGSRKVSDPTEKSPFGLVNLHTGVLEAVQPTDPETAAPIGVLPTRNMIATLSSNEDAILYSWASPQDPLWHRLILRDLSTGREHVVTEDFPPTDTDQDTWTNGLSWASNQSVFATQGHATGLITQLG
jgi:hypothetical protein